MQDSCLILTVLPIFSWTRNSMKLLSILCSASGSQKSKMAVLKEELLIFQHMYTTWLQNSNGKTHVFKVNEFNEDITHTM